MNTPDKNTPDPLTEVPPDDQFCDVVINGGVASGVVYPWALLKLARHYRFKNIGGNSVGAMAAAMAAAAEYGRCTGVENAFEPLRQMPLKLAEVEGGNTLLLRLFQPTKSVSRLFELFLELVRFGESQRQASPAGLTRVVLAVLGLYRVAVPLLVLLLLWFASALAILVHAMDGAWPFLAGVALTLLGALGCVVLVLLLAGWRFVSDLQAMSKNHYGLCTGHSQNPGQEGLVEWLHKGIQKAAGRGRDDRPLNFADLWAAPRFGQPGPAPTAQGVQPPDPSINLQMFSSNVTQARPVRLPLNDANTRLFFHPEEWKEFFPPTIMEELLRVSRTYEQDGPSDPPKPGAETPEDAEEAQQVELLRVLRELPSGEMPIVVAARMSLCFPLLFSCVPVYAIDYEAPSGQRKVRQCLLSDGGLCTNFPVHLFDAAHPRWPTFALLLDKRLQPYKKQAVWLPRTHLEGRGDNWQRKVPGAELEKEKRPLFSRLGGLAVGMLLTTKDWNDRVTGRLPQVRNRVIRLALQPGEGQLNLVMPRETILRMAHTYGTLAGEKLVKRFAPHGSRHKSAWREHVYVRSMVELRALRKHLRGYTRAMQSRNNPGPLALGPQCGATRHAGRPLRERHHRPDAAGGPLTPAQQSALARAVNAVQALEAELAACEGQMGPYEPVPEPELRLRPPM